MMNVILAVASITYAVWQWDTTNLPLLKNKMPNRAIYVNNEPMVALLPSTLSLNGNPAHIINFTQLSDLYWSCYNNSEVISTNDLVSDNKYLISYKLIAQNTELLRLNKMTIELSGVVQIGGSFDTKVPSTLVKLDRSSSLQLPISDDPSPEPNHDLALECVQKKNPKHKVFLGISALSTDDSTVSRVFTLDTKYTCQLVYYYKNETSVISVFIKRVS